MNRIANRPPYYKSVYTLHYPPTFLAPMVAKVITPNMKTLKAKI